MKYFLMISVSGESGNKPGRDGPQSRVSSRHLVRISFNELSQLWATVAIIAIAIMNCLTNPLVIIVTVE